MLRHLMTSPGAEIQLLPEIIQVAFIVALVTMNCGIVLLCLSNVVWT